MRRLFRASSLFSVGTADHLAINGNVQNDSQQHRQHIHHRLRPDQAVLAQHLLQYEQHGDEQNTLAAEVDDEGRRGRAHGLESIGQHIVNAEQEAGGQQNPGELATIFKGFGVSQYQIDDLFGQQIANTGHSSAESKGKEQRKVQRLTEAFPVLSAHTVTKQRLDTLAQTDADHAGDHGDLGSNTHTGHGHIAIDHQLAVQQNLGNAHQHTAQRCGDANDQNILADAISHTEVAGMDAQQAGSLAVVQQIVNPCQYVADNRCDGGTGQLIFLRQKNYTTQWQVDFFITHFQ